MSMNLEQLKIERDQAKSKMMAAVREANEAAEQYIANRNAYDEWQAEKNESSVAMAEFGKANIAYLNAVRHSQSWERDQALDSEHGAVGHLMYRRAPMPDQARAATIEAHIEL